MKAVLVGCGGISKVWFEAAAQHSDLELVGLVDIVLEQAQKRQAEYTPNALVGTNLSDILQQTKPDIVFDCTLPMAHFEVVTTALAHGCHVLGEKPMADTLEQAHTMIEAAQQANKLFVTMQNWRYTHNIRRLKTFLNTKPIGRLTNITADFYIGAHFGGFREDMAHVLLKDMAIHTFDAARFLTGQNPKSVYAMDYNPAGSWYSQDAAAIALFEMTDDVVFSYRGSWCAEGQRTSWESEWRIVGTKGTISWKGDETMTCEVIADSSKESFLRDYETILIPSYDDVTKKSEKHAAVITEFLQAIKNGGIPETVCSDNIKSLAMVYGAVESAQTGKKVAIHL